MTSGKLKEYISLFGGLLSAVLLFLTTLNIKFDWFNELSISAFTAILLAAIPFILVVYGVYKNSYIITKKAKEQEEILKKNGLK